MPLDGKDKQIGDRDRFEHMVKATQDAVVYVRRRRRDDLVNSNRVNTS